MEIFANCRLDWAGEPACGHPREFLDAAVAFVKTERNYIARQNRDREARYGSHTRKSKRQKRKNASIYALHSKASALPPV